MRLVVHPGKDKVNHYKVKTTVRNTGNAVTTHLTQVSKANATEKTIRNSPSWQRQRVWIDIIPVNYSLLILTATHSH